VVANHSTIMGHCIDFSGILILDRTLEYLDHLINEATEHTRTRIIFTKAVASS
jgi:hypothetical protein